MQGIAAIANTSQSDDSEQQEATTPVSTAEPLQSVEREQALPEGMPILQLYPALSSIIGIFTL